jgi:hypothetical protein
MIKHINVGTTGPVAPTLCSNSLGSIIGQFKSVATKRIRKEGCLNFKWQRNYYDRIIRNDKELTQTVMKELKDDWQDNFTL